MATEGEIVAKEQNEAVERFFAGADLLVHDSQYTQNEYESAKVGWGHSSFEHVCSAASRAGVKKLALFHHEPTRTDKEMDELAKVHCRPGKNGNTRIFIAREGMQIEI
jgi:ribonuclease BN (tRNA processing enzyme)